MSEFVCLCCLNGKKKKKKQKSSEFEQPHVDAEGHQVVGAEEVVGDWPSQVEGQLDELEGGACVPGGEDDPAGVVDDGRVRSQDHLSLKRSVRERES